MGIVEEIKSGMMAMRDDVQATHLSRFFKCGVGEYGEGDKFLGVRVPQTRSLVKEYKNRVQLDDCLVLVESPWHEVRLAGFLFMIQLYNQAKKESEEMVRKVVDCYISSIRWANNWDLVDLSAPYILGDWLVTHPDCRQILNQLSDSKAGLWHQRVAMVANWMLIRNGEFDDTFRIAEKYLSHSHDLIHKASGWMLREVGKHGGNSELRGFLDKHATSMPRTMLRYAIEKFPAPERKHYLKLKKQIYPDKNSSHIADS